MNSRQKGARGEREFISAFKEAAGSDIELSRNLEQTRSGGFDIVGLDDWAPEIKRYAEATPALIKGWWEQAVEQSTERKSPVLAYRADRRDWRVVIRASELTDIITGDGIEDTVEMSMPAWIKILRARGHV